MIALVVGGGIAGPVAALALGELEQRLVVERQQIERDEARRGLLGEHVDARLGGVDPLAERVEVLPALLIEEHDLAVQDIAALREGELGEVPAQRFPAARLQIDVRAIDEDDGAESVPFGLIRPARTGWQSLRRTRELGEQWWLVGQRHGRPH